MSNSNNMHKYDDIINLPHYTSSKRPRMAMIDRAAQFSPFAALTGYDAAVKETARLTEDWVELDEYRQSSNTFLLSVREHQPHQRYAVTYRKEKQNDFFLILTQLSLIRCQRSIPARKYWVATNTAMKTVRVNDGQENLIVLSLGQLAGIDGGTKLFSVMTAGQTGNLFD